MWHQNNSIQRCWPMFGKVSFSHTGKRVLHMLLLCDSGPRVLYHFWAVRALFKKVLPIILFHTSCWSRADGRQPPTASSWIPPIRFFHSGQRSVTDTDRRYVACFSTVLSSLGSRTTQHRPSSQKKSSCPVAAGWNTIQHILLVISTRITHVYCQIRD